MGHGYRTVIANIANEDARTTHTVELALPGEAIGYFDLDQVSRTVEVGPLSEVRVQLWLPLSLSWSFAQCRVSLDGRDQEEGLRAAIRNTVMWAYRGGALAPHGHYYLLGQRVSRDAVERLVRDLTPSPPRGFGGPPPTELLRAEREIQAWPTRWLAYSAYDAVMLTSQEWELAPEAVRNALWRYAECGGTLTVAGSFSPPVACRTVASASSREPQSSPGGYTEYEVGLGRCFSLQSLTSVHTLSAMKRLLAHVGSLRTSAWQSQADAQKVHNLAPVVEEVRVPFGLCFGVLAVFAIAAGPVSLSLLRRRNRGIWVFWIAPSLGLVTSGLVIASVLLGEGVTPSARLEGFTILDERVGRATTVGVNGFYSPLRLRRGLAYSYDTEVTACRVDTGMGPQAVSGRDLVWDENQLLSGKWVRPRVPQYFRVRTSELRKERLGIVREGPRLAFVNGLGVAIDRLLMVDFDGKVYEKEGIPAGAQVDAGAPTDTVLPEVRNLSDVILSREDWQEDRRENLPWTGILRPGTYLAYLSKAPFVPNGLQQSAKLNESSVVFGILREEDKQ
jgi:hypothetical protein